MIPQTLLLASEYLYKVSSVKEAGLFLFDKQPKVLEAYN